MPTSLELPADVSRLLARLSGWPRRMAALGCLLAATVGLLNSAGRPRPGPLVPVLVAGRALAPGTSLTVGDLAVQRWPAGSVPVAALTGPAQALGRRTAAVLARGQPIAASSLMEPAIAAALAAGLVAATVSLADPNQLTILRAGSHIDLYAEPSNSILIEGKTVSESASVAKNVTVLAVLAVPPQFDQQLARDSGPSVIIATDQVTAGRLAAHLSTPFLATLVAPP